ncbi:MAG: bifunctional hydroxymethylpyrimidine kinase/phosphomethylpyrimidine kinase [Actinobacteria bacterium]|nr:bifunctional hydroxymethylpyrimidine kinase/phosphomethylpyrimidine kinase [Actinomycetota bacterium]
MTASAPAVVVVGDLMTDVTVHTREQVIARGSDTAATIVIGDGGAGGNVAAGLGWWGVTAGLVTRVGDDAAGRAAVRRVEQTGARVHAQVDATVATGTVIALIDGAGDRTMLTDRGANRRLAVDGLADHWFRDGGHLHLSGYMLFERPARVAAIEALRRAATAGMTISVDPASWSPLQAFGAEQFLAHTATADLCLPNADEARVLTGLDDPTAAARHLGARYGSAVVTCGADGAVWSDGDVVRRQPADAVEAVDTTGAGDTFTARYLAALVAGATHADALALAVRSATGVVGGSGARW